MATTANSVEDAHVVIDARLARAALCLFLATLVLMTLRGYMRANMPFNGPHAFVSADVATTARTFTTQGILHLRGVPVNNNPPIGSKDFYTHWPPLLPVLLSWCFTAFGISERVGHLLMLAIFVTTAGLVFRLGCLWLGTLGGALAGYFWLTLPVVVEFGDLICQQSLAMMFIVAALISFTVRRERLGALLLFVAVLSSWESLLVVPGFWLAARINPAGRRSAVFASVGAVGGFLCVIFLYLAASPTLALDLLQTAKYYMGLSPVYSNFALHDRWSLTLPQQLSGLLWNHLWMLGALGTGALIQFLILRRTRFLVLFLPLITPWLLWTIAMRSHVVIHHFELLIAGPVTALCLSWLTLSFLNNAPRNRRWTVAILPIAVAVQLVVLPKPDIPQGPELEPFFQFSRLIATSTNPDAVVISPLFSAIPLYYSERHIVRGITDDASVAAILPQLHQEFPSARLYLAIPSSFAENFPKTISTATRLSSDEEFTTFELNSPVSR
jgi:hypothetical protein